MEKEQQKVLLRQRKLAVLLYDAHLDSGTSVETCARLMGVTPEKYLEYEEGTSSPSLPEIETFSYGLNIPLSHFLGNIALTSHTARTDDNKLNLIRSLRQKLIGARILQERSRSGISAADICHLLGLTEEELADVESGNIPLPFPQLQIISEILDVDLSTLFDQQGLIGQWRKQQERNESFGKIPSGIQDFICKPANLPYLELAAKLSEMDTEKLRKIAESILEITF
ncbi:MAG: helix-turn-helix transcriptional regulator [Anaerolineaceae bacterium]